MLQVSEFLVWFTRSYFVIFVKNKPKNIPNKCKKFYCKTFFVSFKRLTLSPHSTSTFHHQFFFNTMGLYMGASHEIQQINWLLWQRERERLGVVSIAIHTSGPQHIFSLSNSFCYNSDWQTKAKDVCRWSCPFSRCRKYVMGVHRLRCHGNEWHWLLWKHNRSSLHTEQNPRETLK